MTQEIADRKTADSVLDNDIQKEAKERNDADGKILEVVAANVKNLEAADKTEKEAREAADATLQAALDKLKSDYTAFKTSTNSDLETKTQQITQILADISSVKNLIAGVQATQSEIDETLTSIQNTLATMEKSFENLKQTVADLQTSWETYKEQMSEQYTQFTDTVEKALSNMDKTLREWVTTQLENYVPLTGTAVDKPITGNLVFDRIHTINQLPDPSGRTSVATKNYVDKGDAKNIPLTGTDEGNPVTGEIDIRLTSNLINGLKVRTATANYKTEVNPGTVTLQGEVQNNPVELSAVQGSAATPTALRVYDKQRDKLGYVECADPTEDKHAATKKYVDGKKSEYDEEYYGLTPTAPMSEVWVCKEGGANNGVVIENEGNNTLKFRDEANTANPVLLKNIKTPTEDTDVANKEYVDTTAGFYYPISGNTPMSKCNINGGSITGFKAGNLGNVPASFSFVLGGEDIFKNGNAFVLKYNNNRYLELMPLDNKGTTQYRQYDRSIYFDTITPLTIIPHVGTKFIDVRTYDGNEVGNIKAKLMGYSLSETAGFESSGVFKFQNGNVDVSVIGIKTPRQNNAAANKEYVDQHKNHYVTGVANLTHSVSRIEAGKTVIIGTLPITNTIKGKLISVLAKITNNTDLTNLILGTSVKTVASTTGTSFEVAVFLTNIGTDDISWDALPIEVTYIIDTDLTA